MEKKVLFTLAAVVLLASLALTGCGGGIPQADLDSIKAQLTDAQAKLTAALDDKSTAEADLQKAEADLESAQAEISDIQKQLADLKAKYEYDAGMPAADIAAIIVANYHATHTYSKTDMFICSDMASEVWNMLKTARVDAVIVIGNPDTAITDILQSTHAWVLVDVAPGETLALETTAGTVIPRSQNPNYYHGWKFKNPTDLNNNNDWIKEYNLRVGFRNLLAAEVNAAMTLYNNSSSQAEADKYLELYNKLKELKDDQEAILVQLMEQISGLAERF